MWLELDDETDQESGGLLPVDVVHVGVGVARRTKEEEARGGSTFEVLLFRRQTRGIGFESS